MKTETKEVKIKIAAPPDPEVKILGELNPILNSKHLKRALAVAFSLALAENGYKPEDKVSELANLCRMVGIVKKLGFTEENVKTDDLKGSEASGLGYAKGTAIKFFNDGYAEQYPQKIETCLPFARAALKKYYPSLAVAA